MLGVSPTIAQHKLNLQARRRSIRQKLRRFHPQCQEIIEDEFYRLLVTGLIQEIQYLKWLANIVVFPKKKWKVVGLR